MNKLCIALATLAVVAVSGPIAPASAQIVQVSFSGAERDSNTGALTGQTVSVSFSYDASASSYNSGVYTGDFPGAYAQYYGFSPLTFTVGAYARVFQPYEYLINVVDATGGDANQGNGQDRFDVSSYGYPNFDLYLAGGLNQSSLTSANLPTSFMPTTSLLSYTLTGPSRYSFGSVVFAAVPEGATWAMMILGMGAIGFAMRRRQKVTIRVSYAA